MLNTLVSFTYFDIRARLSIFDEISFWPEDHTDWEMAPPSYDLQSWESLGLNIWESLPPMNHLKQLSQCE